MSVSIMKVTEHLGAKLSIKPKDSRLEMSNKKHHLKNVNNWPENNNNNKLKLTYS